MFATTHFEVIVVKRENEKKVQRMNIFPPMEEIRSHWNDNLLENTIHCTYFFLTPTYSTNKTLL